MITYETQSKTFLLSGKNYSSEVNAYMQQLSDDGILSLTSENELDILNMDEDANAVFIIVPDERFTRHRFVTLFITQMYKELVEKANLNSRREETEAAILKRNVYIVYRRKGKWIMTTSPCNEQLAEHLRKETAG